MTTILLGMDQLRGNIHTYHHVGEGSLHEFIIQSKGRPTEKGVMLEGWFWECDTGIIQGII